MLYTADIGKVIQQYGLSYHSYADDNQLYSSCNQHECAALKSRMIKCIESIGEWMSSNRLMLNPSKSEFMCYASQRWTHLIDRWAFVLFDGLMNVSSSHRNLGTYFDESMSMTEYVNHLVHSCFNQLRRFRFIRRSLTTTVATRLVNSFLIARVDYCNSILAGLPKYQLSRIQSVLHVAAWIVYDQARFEHVMLTLRDRLHWLCVPQKNEFKRCLLVFKALQVLAPVDIKNYCVKVSSKSQVIITPSPHHSSTF